MVAIAVLVAAAEEPSDWIRQHPFPLRTVEANRGFDDLQPLGPVAKWFANFVPQGASVPPTARTPPPTLPASHGRTHSMGSCLWKTDGFPPVQRFAWMANVDDARGFSTVGA